MRDGILISFGDGSWADLQIALLQQISEKATFFQGARLALDVGDRILHAAEMGALRDQLSERGVSLWAILGNSPTTERTAQVLGLATRLHAPKPERKILTNDTNDSSEMGIVVHRTLPSGFKLTSHSHVTVIGDVNPGAEITAAGSIFVWGRLKGVVHAGVDGDEQAVVCALELTPTQLKIANIIAISPRRRGKSQPEMARVVGGQVIAKSWDQKKGK